MRIVCGELRSTEYEWFFGLSMWIYCMHFMCIFTTKHIILIMFRGCFRNGKSLCVYCVCAANGSERLWTIFGAAKYTCKLPNANKGRERKSKQTHTHTLSTPHCCFYCCSCSYCCHCHCRRRRLLTIINGNFDQQELNLLYGLSSSTSSTKWIHTHTCCLANVRIKYVVLNGVILFIFIIILQYYVLSQCFSLQSKYGCADSVRFFFSRLLDKLCER